MTYRWLTNEEVLEIVNPELRKHGWAELNTAIARVLGAFYQTGELVEFFVLQLYPMLGPLLRLDNINTDNGAVSRELARRMDEFMTESQARGCLTIADNPVTVRLCERYGMTRVESPVFTRTG